MKTSKWMASGTSAALALVLVSASPVMAWQGATETSKIVRKNRAPVSNEVLRVNLPKAVEATLENGLKVLILEDDRQPIVSVQLNISGAGGLFEPSESVGLAGVTAQMLRDGTATRSKQEILEEVGRLGATLSSRPGLVPPSPPSMRPDSAATWTTGSTSYWTSCYIRLFRKANWNS